MTRNVSPFLHNDVVGCQRTRQAMTSGSCCVERGLAIPSTPRLP